MSIGAIVCSPPQNLHLLAYAVELQLAVEMVGELLLGPAHRGDFIHS